MNNYFEKGLITHRAALGFFLNKYGLIGTAVEIGCARGQFARETLSQWEGKSYWLVDPWEAQDPEIYRESQTNDWSDWHHQCELICQEDKRVQMIKGYSADAVNQFQSASLDLAYIDANHSYAFVMNDMDLWWPKVKIGGILAGHDFGHNTEGGSWIEVDRAVERWAREHNVIFYVTSCSSWWIHKTTP